MRQGGSVQNWNDIAMSLPGRTNKDCRKRWAKIQVDIRKGAWTQEEDERLQKAVLQLGCKWSQVGTMVQSRNADQCAKRWQHVLGPDVKHCSWTPDEDRKLLNAMSKFGNNWKQIGLTELPDRSTHDLRNRSLILGRRSRHAQAKGSNSSPPSLQGSIDEEMANNSPGGNDEEESCDGDGDDVSDEGSESELTDSRGKEEHRLLIDMNLLFEDPVEATELGAASTIMSDNQQSHTFLEVPALELPGSTFNMFDPSCIGNSDLSSINSASLTPDTDWTSWLNSLEADTSVSPDSRPSWWDEGSTEQHYFHDSGYGSSIDVKMAGIPDSNHSPRARKRVKGEASPSASLRPGARAENPLKDNVQMGLITLSLDQVDPIIANEIIGSVLKHGAGLKINCTVNNHS
ncbi:hypothetical protein BDP81DRAFT_43638 [Colletotrichum phormii]|uniref:Myb-related protein B n=1 Tax=Colletotrichum phormii TaxID=359342 RepID=A0AAJ0EEJ6_9PEZI|nr:uncharacterized protein BDP81DRAFT_43638 [Colletotrichum phormii]KAK1635918.1 hypothetical protein BDP81DRAFT_43638 [Colletotrichum phormii]